MVAVEGERLFDCLVNDNGQTGFIRITELFIERTNDKLRRWIRSSYLDQVSGRGCVSR